MGLARSERERLWKGLERFVSCGDDLTDFNALGRGYPGFWPIEVFHCPEPVDLDLEELEGLPNQSAMEAKLEENTTIEPLNWNAACHRLFLFYRDSLRKVWGRQEFPDLPEFLLGLSDWNETARLDAGRDKTPILPTYPMDLYDAWGAILDQFPYAASNFRLPVSMLWDDGDFYLAPENDFQRAFYLLFRQSWRARTCRRCTSFFIARKPKQKFCGTACSAGSRLAAKRKWWKRIGAKERARRRETVLAKTSQKGKTDDL
jgi:hypothetical protein